MSRGANVVLIILATFAASFMLFGGAAGGRATSLLMVGPVIVVVGGWYVFGRRARTVELGWGGRGEVAQRPPARLGEPLSEARRVAVQRPPSAVTAVARAIARVEARELVRTPWFAVGVALQLLMIVLLGWVWVDAALHWRFIFVQLPIMAFPATGMAVCAAHQAVTRQRRDRAAELLQACPTTTSTRTAGQLLAGWVPAAAIAAFVAAFLITLRVHERRPFGAIDGDAIADLVTAVVLGACGWALGVALGRWAPWRLAPIVALFVVLWATMVVGNIGKPHWGNARQLSPWPRYPAHDILFTDRPAWRHLAWIVALGVAMVIIALLRSSPTRRVLVAAGATVVALVSTGVLTSRPISAASARHLASLVAQPELHQTCAAAARVEVCSYAEYAHLRDAVLAEVGPVGAAVPGNLAGDAATLRFAQRFDGDVEVLGPDVVAAIANLQAASPAPDGRERIVDIGFDLSDQDRFALRVRAAVALTMPDVAIEPADATEVHGSPWFRCRWMPDVAIEPADATPLVVAGEARGVVALWLSTRGLATADALDALTVRYDPQLDEDGVPDAWDLGNQGLFPDPCDVGTPPVAWSQQDLAAARQLVARPAGEVGALLAANWSAVTAPGFGTDELMALAGLAPVGPFDRVEAPQVECGW